MPGVAHRSRLPHPESLQKSKEKQEGDSNIVKKQGLAREAGMRRVRSRQRVTRRGRVRSATGCILRAILIKCGPATGFRVEWKLREGNSFRL